MEFTSTVTTKHSYSLSMEDRSTVTTKHSYSLSMEDRSILREAMSVLTNFQNGDVNFESLFKTEGIDIYPNETIRTILAVLDGDRMEFIEEEN